VWPPPAFVVANVLADRDAWLTALLDTAGAAGEDESPRLLTQSPAATTKLRRKAPPMMPTRALCPKPRGALGSDGWDVGCVFIAVSFSARRFYRRFERRLAFLAAPSIARTGDLLEWPEAPLELPTGKNLLSRVRVSP